MKQPLLRRSLQLPLLLTSLFVQRAMALPLSLTRRLSTISPELEFSALAPTSFRTEVLGSAYPTSTAASCAVSLPNGIPVLSSATVFSASPSSLLEILQSVLRRLILTTRFRLGLPAPFAFLASCAVVFVFMLCGLFVVLGIWHAARLLVGSVRGQRWEWDEREVKIRNNGRECVVRRRREVMRIVLRPSPRTILSPASSRSSIGEESPCPVQQKKVRWVDEERGRGRVVCKAGTKEMGGGVDLLGGMELEMEKVDYQ